MQTIGPYQLENNLFLAPMVGVSDTPFREICSEQGAGLTVGEMLTCNKELWHNKRNRLKQIKPLIRGPQVVQIAGSSPNLMAEAAQLNEGMGAHAIDINMGCPAKKVLKKAAGSALLKDTGLVEAILKAVVNAVEIPVTLKIRTGWCPGTRNGPLVARIAEDAGVRLLTVHGRTRADRFKGEAEYDTIAEIKQAVTIPIIANGDIDSPQKAAQVLSYTQADGIMIGRAAKGRPWLFNEIARYLDSGTDDFVTPLPEKARVIGSHLKKMYAFYGKVKGVWYARKHVAGYVSGLPLAKEFMSEFNASDSGQQQLELIEHFFDHPTIKERESSPHE